MSKFDWDDDIEIIEAAVPQDDELEDFGLEEVDEDE